MSDLKNALLGAFKGKGLPEPTIPTSAHLAEPPALPDPLKSPWVAELRAQRVEIPKDASIGQLTSRSDVRCKELKAAGRTREAASLLQLKEQFLREREKRAWERVKERFSALDLNEKAYRALKQEAGVDPVKVLAKLTSKRSEELRGISAARVREALLS
jgi:hypothetical protein